MDQSISTQASESFEEENELDIQIISPNSRGWVNDHYKLAQVADKRMRVCTFIGCNKMYAAASSHQVLRKHWTLEHESESKMKLTRFLFSDEIHTNRLIKMIIDLHLDYTTVEKQSFREFVESLNPNKRIICRRTLSDTVMNKTNYLAQKIAERLSSVDCMSLTFDIWSPRKGARGFGCITAHYIGDGKSENLILNFKRMRFPHDADSICKFLYKTIQFHKLENRVVSITTDNASNNISGIRKLETSISLSPLSQGFVHYKCVAHIIDLAVRAAMKELKPVMNGVRAAILSIRSSTKRKETFRLIQERLISDLDQQTDGPLELIEDIDHRWGSGFQMLERAHLLRSAIDELLSVTPELMNIEKIDWPLVEELISFLSPFHEATKRLCVEKDCSISVVSFITPKLIEHCIGHHAAANRVIKNAAVALSSKLDNYRTEVYHPIVNIAYALDPRYKIRGLPENDSNIVRNELRTLVDSMSDQDSRTRSSQPNKIFLDDSDDEEPFDELESYLVSRREHYKTNAFSYWKTASLQYPKLARIAQRILCIQATSVASERVFSVAGNVDTLCRNRLSDRSVESIVLSKSWMKFLDLE